MTDRERLEAMIVTTISGLEATYKHYKDKYPLGTHGHVVCSSIPNVKNLVETYLVELNKEIQDSMQEEQVKESLISKHEDKTCKENVNSLTQETVSEDFKDFEVEYFEREKDNIVCVYDRHAGLVDGAQWQKQKLMAKAVDGIVHHHVNCKVASVYYNDPDNVPMAYYIPSEGLSAGDKVKIITIKED